MRKYQLMQSRAFEGGGAGQDLSTEIKNVRGPVLLRDGETGLTHVCSGGETFYLSLGEGGCGGECWRTKSRVSTCSAGQCRLPPLRGGGVKRRWKDALEGVLKHPY